MKELFPEMQQVSFSYLSVLYDPWLRWIDAAILRFSDSVASVEITRQRWINIYRANFNSKAFIYNIS